MLTFEDGTKAIFKPDDEEMEIGTATAEVLARELDRSLGWGLVPETVPYVHEGEWGSLQRWVEDSVSMAEVEGSGGEAWPSLKGVGPEALRLDPRIAVLDGLMDNRERHVGNVVTDKGGKQWAIDNGAGFGGSAPRYVDGEAARVVGIASVVPERYLPVLKELADWRDTKAYGEYRAKHTRMLGEESAVQFERNLSKLIEGIK